MKGAALKTLTFDKLLDLLVPPPEHTELSDGSKYERFALPHTFKPQLSFYQACVSVVAALSKIFLGSLLFAVWGAYSFKVWTVIANIFLRLVVLQGMLLLFLASFAAVMIGITALARRAARKPV